MTSGLDQHLVAPARLTLAASLSAVSKAEFALMRDHLDVSDSVLSKHVGVLEEAGYVTRRKGMHEGRRTTWLALTARGRRALTSHVAALRSLIAGVE